MTKTSDTGSCLTVSLQSVASHIRASDGRDVPFTRAVLTVRNDCGKDIIDLSPNVSLGQEGGTTQDVSGALSGSAQTLAPGGTISWDVFDLLLPAHPGTSSRVHMFGYRAVLNWRFDLTAGAAYRVSGSSDQRTTHETRWSLRWSMPDPSTGAVALSIENS